MPAILVATADNVEYLSPLYEKLPSSLTKIVYFVPLKYRVKMVPGTKLYYLGTHGLNIVPDYPYIYEFLPNIYVQFENLTCRIECNTKATVFAV